jgi:hypothetical protein
VCGGGSLLCKVREGEGDEHGRVRERKGDGVVEEDVELRW